MNLEESNTALKDAVATRIKNVAEGKSAENWYDRDGERVNEIVEVFRGVAEAAKQARPGSTMFMGILEELRAVHLKKSQDYGNPDDALANIKAGAELVGIEPWRGCVIRMADKMQRIRSYCRDGKLANEGFEDALLDLASYAIIALVMFRQDKE